MGEFHGKQRLHKAYITISCSGPEQGIVRSSFRGDRRSRDGADLRYTTADCDWFYQYLREPNYDTGLAEQHYRLVNPTNEEVSNAINSAGQFLTQYIGEPNWAGGQITFVYAGHGMQGSGAWVLEDGLIDGPQLAEQVAAAVTPNTRRCRVDLILDSCFSGAFFADFLSYSWISLNDRIFPCDAFGSALSDELAWELDEYGHGVFTYAFKNMSEPLITGYPSLPQHKQTHIRDIDRLRSGGVSWLTDDEQHAFEYINGHLEIIGGGHANFHEVEKLSSDQVRLAMADALNVMPREGVVVRM